MTGLFRISATINRKGIGIVTRAIRKKKKKSSAALPIQGTKNGSYQSHSVAKISDAKSKQTRLGCERMRGKLVVKYYHKQKKKRVKGVKKRDP